MKRSMGVKRVFGMLLSMLLVLSVLSGCKSEPVAETDNNNSSSVKAGTYTATEDSFGGELSVSVVVESDGSVSGVEVNAENDTPTVGGEAAPKLADKIVETQSLNLDVVSGASVTSNALLTAVGAALAEAGVDVEAWKTKEVVKNGTDEEVSVDVVVVGAGGSGTGAALAAAEAGSSVMIIEKTAAVGGNTKLSSGFFAVNSDLQRAEGLELSVDEAVNRLLEFNRYLSNGPLTRAIVEKSADTVNWLQGYGMEFYLQQETTQFAHEDDVYKYKGYHKYVDTEAGFKQIYEHLGEMGAELRLNTSLASIVQSEDGTVTGITAMKEDGGTLTVHAKATVICTGGFGANTEKLSDVMNGAYLNSLGMPNGGEGLEMMEGLGAINWDATALLHAAQLAESEVAQSSGSEHLAGFSNSSLTQLLMSPLLWVDASGSRFVNEDVVYDTAYWANAAYAAGGKYYFVVDEATLKDYTAGTSMRISKAGPGANMESDDFVALAEAAVAGGTAFKGSTISELADNAGMEAEDLEASISRYNQMINNQKDTDYNKSTVSLKYTVETGTLYAFDCRAVSLGTIGGMKVNEKLEVINMDYDSIKGLYTAGTNAGGYYEGQGYPPYEGLASGFAWTSGRIAGESATEYALTK